MLNKEFDWIKERLQIISMIEYLDSINDGSVEAVDNLHNYSLKVQVEDNDLEIQLDHNSFDAVYNMLRELRSINASKKR